MGDSKTLRVVIKDHQFIKYCSNDEQTRMKRQVENTIAIEETNEKNIFE